MTNLPDPVGRSLDKRCTPSEMHRNQVPATSRAPQQAQFKGSGERKPRYTAGDEHPSKAVAKVTPTASRGIDRAIDVRNK